VRSLWRRSGLAPVPPLQETYIIPFEVRRAYVVLAEAFDSVQVGHNERWVLGTNVSRGGIRAYYSARGDLVSLQVMRRGRNVSRIVGGDLIKAVDVIREKDQ
jgi:hypothetical protein